MNRTHHHMLTLFFAGAGVSALVWGPATISSADPVPLRPTKPAVTLTGVRSVDAPPDRARGALNIPPTFDPFTEPSRTPPPTPAAPTSGGGFFSGFAGESRPKALFSTAPAALAPQPGMTPPPQYQPQPQYQPGYPPQYQPPYPPQYQPGYAPQNQPPYPPQYQPGYQPQNQPGYPPPYPPAGYGQQPVGAPANKSLWTSLTSWTTDKAQSVRSLESGQPKPGAPLPQARVGQLPAPAPVPAVPPAPQPPAGPAVLPRPNGPEAREPFQGTLPSGNPALAGRPAYRWYGWGATTPGQNPYAPTGEYPATSSQWYAMTGATPGAFPVPVTNPFRSPPGYESPAYAVAPPARRTPATPSASSLGAAPREWETNPGEPRPIAETPPFTYTPGNDAWPSPGVPNVPSPNNPAMDNNWRSFSTPMTPAPPPRGREASGPISKEMSNHEWQPVHYTTPVVPTRRGMDGTWQPSSTTWPADDAPIGPRVRGQVADRPTTLADRVQACCNSGIRELEVKRLGEHTVIVRFTADTAANARQAATAISALAELKSDTVMFDTIVQAK